MKGLQDTTAAIAQEAVEWALELQAHGATLEQRTRFVSWLRRSPLHVSEYLKLLALQADLAQLPTLRSLDVEGFQAGPGPQSAGAVVIDFPHALRASQVDAEAVPPMAGRLSRRIGLSGIAAALAALAISAALLSQFWGGAHYRTGVGEQRSVTLQDGSLVRINVRSDLAVRVDERIRDLTLRSGEALFQVAKDPAHPFRVHTPQAMIEAKGTRFDVRVRDGRTVVVLLEGHVLVSPPDAQAPARRANGSDGPSPVLRPVLLNPGEEVVIDGGTARTLSPSHTDVAAATGWLQGRLVFDDTQLSQVVAEFNRYAGEQVVIDDPEVAALRVTASFDAENAPAFARSVAAAASLQVTREADGRWHIAAR